MHFANSLLKDGSSPHQQHLKTALENRHLHLAVVDKQARLWINLPRFPQPPVVENTAPFSGFFHFSTLSTVLLLLRLLYLKSSQSARDRIRGFPGNDRGKPLLFFALKPQKKTKKGRENSSLSAYLFGGKKEFLQLNFRYQIERPKIPLFWAFLMVCPFDFSVFMPLLKGRQKWYNII